jgi:hypothetical protein
MNALHLDRRLRPHFWTAALLALVAIIDRQAATSAPGSISAADDRDAGRVDAKPGLTFYPAEEWVSAPQLEGTTMGGEHFSLSGWDGQMTVGNVGGPWRAGTPDLVPLAWEDAGRGARFVAINTHENPAVARACIKRFDVEDDNGGLLLNFRNVIPALVVPSSAIVDRRGKVAAGVSGPVSYTTLGGLLEGEIAATGTRP